MSLGDRYNVHHSEPHSDSHDTDTHDTCESERAKPTGWGACHLVRDREKVHKGTVSEVEHLQDFMSGAHHLTEALKICSRKQLCNEPLHTLVTT